MTSGNSRSCGCKQAEFIAPYYDKDLQGQRFGRLVAIERAPNQLSPRKGYIKRKRFWTCQCDCGNIVAIDQQNLLGGKTRSCGCLQKEEASARFCKDMTGKQFGFLTVLQREGRKGSQATWLCQCECGNQVVVTGNLLRNGGVQSCGCKHLSLREALIDRELRQHGVSFAREVSFADLVGDKGRK